MNLNPDDNSWIIQQSKENETLVAYSKMSTLPVGLQDWTLVRSNKTHKLKFSKCKRDQFTCYDGACISLSQKCNQIVDCSDFSDEKNCQLLEFNEVTYESNHPPIQKGRVQVRILELRIYYLV